MEHIENKPTITPHDRSNLPAWMQALDIAGAASIIAHQLVAEGQMPEPVTPQMVNQVVKWIIRGAKETGETDPFNPHGTDLEHSAVVFEVAGD